VVVPGLSSGVALADSASKSTSARIVDSVPAQARLHGPAQRDTRALEVGNALTLSQLRTANARAAQREAAAVPSRAEVADLNAEVERARQAELAAAQAAKRRADARARASRAAQRAKVVQRQKAAAAQAHDWVRPVRSYRFSSPFGMRWGRLHAGNDFAAPIGTPLYSLSSGTVILASSQSGYGNKVEIRFWDGTVAWYGHMSRIDVNVGDKVGPGEQIGTVGNTGHSTGPHLHLEIHPGGGGPINPKPWLAARGVNI
jgi:murein DD-endopeptidase MepM/ murein hydrolase activator NlpD